jgi:excisionase family DNA binding protein
MHDFPELLTVGEAAVVLRQTPESVRQKIRAGRLRAVRLGDHSRCPLRLERAEVLRFLGVPAPGEALHASLGERADDDQGGGVARRPGPLPIESEAA